MPVYVYRCTGGHEHDITHAMSARPRVVCPDCGAVMHKVPQVFSVTWGGLAPSREPERSPEVQDLINPESIARRRDEYERIHDGQ